MYLIIQCYSCGNILIGRSGQKTKLCTYCNSRISVPKTRILAEADSAAEATRIAIYLKNNQNE